MLYENLELFIENMWLWNCLHGNGVSGQLNSSHCLVTMYTKYKNSKINRSDKVVVDLQDNLKETSKTLEFGGLRVPKNYFGILKLIFWKITTWHKVFEPFFEIITKPVNIPSEKTCIVNVFNTFIDRYPLIIIFQERLDKKDKTLSIN